MKASYRNAVITIAGIAGIVLLIVMLWADSKVDTIVEQRRSDRLSEVAEQLSADFTQSMQLAGSSFDNAVLFSPQVCDQTSNVLEGKHSSVPFIIFDCARVTGGKYNHSETYFTVVGFSTGDTILRLQKEDPDSGWIIESTGRWFFAYQRNHDRDMRPVPQNLRQYMEQAFQLYSSSTLDR
ncbi:MAG: hypothetical protein HOO67_03780 [Candidatus Peribacteraceae bacterium]|nr:hypothetical protein [Candidatus Peribacteraceae bacterium]